MGGTGRPLGKTFFLHCQRGHPELPKIPTYLPVIDENEEIDLNDMNEPRKPFVSISHPWEDNERFSLLEYKSSNLANVFLSQSKWMES